MMPNCACTVPGMVCAKHRDLPVHERPQPPLFTQIVELFAQHLEEGLEAQVEEWSHEMREDH